MGTKGTKYDRATLEPIVRTSHSLAEVMRRLGLRPTGGNHRMISSRVRLAGLDTSHFVYGKYSSRVEQIDPEVLRVLVRDHTSMAQVLMTLGLNPEGRDHHNLKARLRSLKIDSSHFRGPGWSRGETRATHPSVDRLVRSREFPPEAVFVENSPIMHGAAITRRLIAMGWPYRCAWCGITEWRGTPIVLHLDHINGINNDNRLANLRWLCPNCHSQTDTYCNRAREEAACYTFGRASVA